MQVLLFYFQSKSLTYPTPIWVSRSWQDRGNKKSSCPTWDKSLDFCGATQIRQPKASALSVLSYLPCCYGQVPSSITRPFGLSPRPPKSIRQIGSARLSAMPGSLYELEICLLFFFLGFGICNLVHCKWKFINCQAFFLQIPGAVLSKFSRVKTLELPGHDSRSGGQIK